MSSTLKLAVRQALSGMITAALVVAAAMKFGNAAGMAAVVRGVDEAFVVLTCVVPQTPR